MTDTRPISHAPQALEVRPTTVLSLMGGIGAIVFIGVLLVAIILLDLFALPSIMAQIGGTGTFTTPAGTTISGPNYVFVDVCSKDAFSNTSVGAGGFALALFTLCGFAILGLHLFFRRSILPAFLIFLACIAAQVFVFDFSLQSVINANPANPVHWVAEWLVEKGVLCDGSVSIAEWAQHRYLIVDRSLTLNEAHLPIQMTKSVLFNLFVLALAGVVIWGLGILTVLWKLVARLFGRRLDNTARENRPLWGWIGLPERTILFQSALLILAIVMSGLFIIMLREPYPARYEAIQDIIWAGGLLLLLDLARYGLFTAPQLRQETVERDVGVGERELVLRPVAAMIEKRFDQNIKVRLDLSPPGTEQAEARKESPLQPGEGLVVNETLTGRHFAHFARVIEESVLDQGKTVLIVCPNERLDAVEETMETLLGSGKANGLRPVFWRVGQMRPHTGLIDVILASPVTLEILVNRAHLHRTELSLLGGFVALNLDKMDLGLLEISLKRLKEEVAHPDQMVALVQSEFRQNIDNWSHNIKIMPDASMRDERTNFHDRKIPRTLFVVSRDANEGYDEKGDLPIGDRILLEAGRMERRVAPFVLGKENEFGHKIWQDNVLQLLTHDPDRAFLGWLSKVDHPLLVPPEVTHPLAVVEDNKNLADALTTLVVTEDALEGLRVVVAGNYPGAVFLSRRLHDLLEGLTKDEDKRDALTRFQKDYASIAVKPAGGPLELALMIRQTFQAEAAARARAFGAKDGDIGAHELRLSQDRVDEIWSHASQALKQLRINNTRGGLGRLFRTTFRLPPGEAVVHVRSADGDDQHIGRSRIKNYVLTGAPADGSEAIVGLTMSRGSGRVIHVPLADHGLSYAQGTKLLTGANVNLITEVNEAAREIYAERRNVPLHPYVFVRDYAISFNDEQQLRIAADDFDEEPDSLQPYEIVTGYAEIARRSSKAFEFNTLSRPFGPSPERDKPQQVTFAAESRCQMRSVSLLRLLSSGGAKKPRSAPTGSLLGGGGVRSRAGGEIPAKVAFTLAVTLQDVLAMQFPGHAHRIAVLCPEAQINAATVGDDVLEKFVLQRAPSLVPMSDTSLPVERTGDFAEIPSTEFQKQVAEFSRDFASLGKKSKGSQVPPGDARLTLIVVEDSDHDLGVARAMHEYRNRILRIWLEFLEHCAASGGNPSESGYDFGAGRLSKAFDFKAAHKILKDIHTSHA